jgi:hypothetical protein
MFTVMNLETIYLAFKKIGFQLKCAHVCIKGLRFSQRLL